MLSITKAAPPQPRVRARSVHQPVMRRVRSIGRQPRATDKFIQSTSTPTPRGRCAARASRDPDPDEYDAQCFIIHRRRGWRRRDRARGHATDPRACGSARRKRSRSPAARSGGKSPARRFKSHRRSQRLPAPAGGVSLEPGRNGRESCQEQTGGC